MPMNEGISYAEEMYIFFSSYSQSLKFIYKINTFLRDIILYLRNIEHKLETVNWWESLLCISKEIPFNLYYTVYTYPYSHAGFQLGEMRWANKPKPITIWIAFGEMFSEIENCFRHHWKRKTAESAGGRELEQALNPRELRAGWWLSWML